MQFVNSKSFSLAAITLSIVASAALFQNCSGQMESKLASQDQTVRPTSFGLVSDLTQPGQATVNVPFKVTGNLFSLLPKNVRLIWDTQIGTGLDYCAQTSPVDKSYVMIVCPKAGQLRVTLTAILPDDTEQVYELMITVAEVGANPSPTPSPSATPLDGRALFTQYCAGCHGSAATTSKRNMTLTRLNNAISGNIGGMGNLSSLTNAQREAIVRDVK
jgi:hypothetical protein